MTEQGAEREVEPRNTSLLGPRPHVHASLATTALAQRALNDLARIDGGSLIVRGPCEHYHWYPRLPEPHVFVRGAEEALVALGGRSFAVVVIGWDVSPEAAELVRARVAPDTFYLRFRATFYVWRGSHSAGHLLPDWDSGEHCPAPGGIEWGARDRCEYTVHVACWGAGGKELHPGTEEADGGPTESLDMILGHHLGVRTRTRPPQLRRPDGSVPRPVVGGASR